MSTGLHVPRCPKHELLTLQGVCPYCAHDVVKLQRLDHLTCGFWALDCAEALIGNLRPGALVGFPEWSPDRAEVEHQERSVEHLRMYVSVATEELAQAELAQGDRVDRWLRRNFRKGWALAALGWVAAIILGLDAPDPGQLVTVVLALVVVSCLVAFRIVGWRLW